MSPEAISFAVTSLHSLQASTCRSLTFYLYSERAFSISNQANPRHYPSFTNHDEDFSCFCYYSRKSCHCPPQSTAQLDTSNNWKHRGRLQLEQLLQSPNHHSAIYTRTNIDLYPRWRQHRRRRSHWRQMYTSISWKVDGEWHHGQELLH